MAARTVESLAPLAPARTVSLDVRFDPSLGPERVRAWHESLAQGLDEEGSRVVPVGTPGSVHVTIDVAFESGEGATSGGTGFVAVRASARVRVLRADVVVEGRPVVAPSTTSRESLESRAADSLLRRVVGALTW